MSRSVKDIVEEALSGLLRDGFFKKVKGLPEVIIEKPRKEGFGDFSTNVAMLLSPLEGRPPREIAAPLAGKIKENPQVERCEVAGPGFINIFLEKSYWPKLLDAILEKGDLLGTLDVGKGRRVQVEFVSANPTGPLHIGHGRGAAVGDALSNILEAAGFEVTREFYINDRGRQMEVLGTSVHLRYQELLGEKVELPEEMYRGEYIREVAREVLSLHGEKFRGAPAQAAPFFSEFAGKKLLDGIRKDLEDFGVSFDVWYSEKSLYERGLVEKTIDELREKGFLYEMDGALWFRTTDLGDDKDRVLVKADGLPTYFASDVAYHRDKAERGFSTLINVWGADHHGYEGRIRALIKALGRDEGVLKVVFIQLVTLLRAGVPVPMGKREGEFVTLRQVMDEVGRDAARFFFLMRRSDAHLDFDLELAKKAAPENPVYYVQYCHARVSSIFEFAKEKGIDTSKTEPELLQALTLKEEIDIIKHLSSFEEVLERSASALEPHRITFYLMELAGLFHPYYNANRVVSDDSTLTLARLLLCKAVATVTSKGLKLLGVSAPVKM